MSGKTSLEVEAFEKDGEHYAVDPDAPDRVARFRAMWGEPDVWADYSDEDVDRMMIQKPIGKLTLTATRWRTLPYLAFRR